MFTLAVFFIIIIGLLGLVVYLIQNYFTSYKNFKSENDKTVNETFKNEGFGQKSSTLNEKTKVIDEVLERRLKDLKQELSTEENKSQKDTQDNFIQEINKMIKTSLKLLGMKL